MEKKRSEEKNVLVVDSGDLFFKPRAIGHSDQFLAKGKLIAKAYRRMGADAMNIGDEDLAQGIDFLKEQAAQGLPLISANLIEASTGKTLFPPFRIKSVEGLRIAFVGLMPNLTAHLPKSVGDSIRVKNPTEVAREIIPTLRDKADLIILLSDLGSYADAILVRSVPGIHVILGGHEGRHQKYPQKEGMTYIFQSNTKGMYVGILRLSIENPALPFFDQGAPEQIRDKMFNLDRTLLNLQRTKEAKANPSIDQRIEDIQRQKAALLEQFKRLKETPVEGNPLLWNLFPLEKPIPEHEETQKEITKAGMVQD